MGLLDKFRKFRRAAKYFLFGLFYFDLYMDLLKTAKRYKDIINIFIIGELLGIPFMSTHLGLRLLPYLFPELEKWKERQLKERDITDEVPETI